LCAAPTDGERATPSTGREGRGGRAAEREGGSAGGRGV